MPIHSSLSFGRGFCIKVKSHIGIFIPISGLGLSGYGHLFPICYFAQMENVKCSLAMVVGGKMPLYIGDL